MSERLELCFPGILLKNFKKARLDKSDSLAVFVLLTLAVERHQDQIPLFIPLVTIRYSQSII